MKIKSLLASALLATAALPLFGTAYTYNNMAWTDTFSLGRWFCKFTDGKSYAKSHNTPMVVVWASPTCGYCENFEKNVAATSTVKTWAENHGYVMIFALNGEDGKDRGMKASDVNAAFKFASSGQNGKFPLIGIWWPKNPKTGKEVKAWFTGRTGEMPKKSGSIAQQFMDSVDSYVGDYVKPQTFTVTFDANGGTIAAAEKTCIAVSGKTIGTFPAATRTGYKLTGWATAASGGAAVKATTKITGNATYYAQWKKVVTLTLKDSPEGEGKLVGAGQYDEGAKVAVKTAPKNKGIFQCWKDGSGNVVTNIPKFNYTLGTKDVTLTAYFITKQQDLDSIVLKVNGTSMAAYEVNPRKVSWYQGVAFDWPVQATADTVATPSATGLPSGLKLVKDKNTGKYSITGVPTTVSKKDKNGTEKPSNVTIKVKTSGGNTKPYKMAFTILPRPAFTEGVFNGYTGTDKKNPDGIIYNLTVAANGKVSGKMLRDGLTYTLSAPSLFFKDGMYAAAIDGKAKGSATSVIATFSESEVGDYSCGVLSAANEWTAIQTPWKTNDKLKATAKKIAKVKPITIAGALAEFGDVTLKFGSNGAVTVKGGGVSSSAVLIPNSDEPDAISLYFYLLPKSSFPGCPARLVLKWDGTNFSL